MNAPIDPGHRVLVYLDGTDAESLLRVMIEDRARLLKRLVDEQDERGRLHLEVMRLREELEAKFRASPESRCDVCGGAFEDGDAVAVRHAHHSIRTVERPPPTLTRAVNDLLARLDARDDVGAATRLAIQAVRQELQAAGKP